MNGSTQRRGGVWETLIGWFVDNTLIVFVLTSMLVVAGLYVAPFAFDAGSFERDPVPVENGLKVMRTLKEGWDGIVTG